MSRRDTTVSCHIFFVIECSEKCRHQEKICMKTKNEYKDASQFEKFIEERINSLKLQAPKNTQKSLTNYFAKSSTSTISVNKQPAANVSSSTNAKNIDVPNSETRKDSNSDVSNQVTSGQKKNVNLKRKYVAPSQDESKLKVQALHSQLTSLTLIKDSNLGGDTINQDIKKVKMDLIKNETKLRTQIKNAEYQRNFRAREKKKKLLKQNNVQKENEDDVQLQVGRPRKEVEYPELLKTIC
ncbi:hypothetical protein TKK_0008583 [Trichogramma kaykai]